MNGYGRTGSGWVSLRNACRKFDIDEGTNIAASNGEEEAQYRLVHAENKGSLFSLDDCRHYTFKTAIGKDGAWRVL